MINREKEVFPLARDTYTMEQEKKRYRTSGLKRGSEVDTHHCSPKCFLQEEDKTGPQAASCSLRWILHSCFQIVFSTKVLRGHSGKKMSLRLLLQLIAMTDSGYKFLSYKGSDTFCRLDKKRIPLCLGRSSWRFSLHSPACIAVCMSIASNPYLGSKRACFISSFPLRF